MKKKKIFISLISKYAYKKFFCLYDLSLLSGSFYPWILLSLWNLINNSTIFYQHFVLCIIQNWNRLHCFCHLKFKTIKVPKVLKISHLLSHEEKCYSHINNKMPRFIFILCHKNVVFLTSHIRKSVRGFLQRRRKENSLKPALTVVPSLYSWVTPEVWRLQ